MNMILKRQVANLKKGKKKGFTLIEVIVVLVILAILAAVAVPALTGYIDKARSRAVISEGHIVLTTLQTIVSEAYGDNITAAGTVYDTTSKKLIGAYITDFNNISDLDADKVTEITLTNGKKVTGFKYATTTSNGPITVVYDGSKFTTE